jgi:HSP20 family protein
MSWRFSENGHLRRKKKGKNIIRSNAPYRSFVCSFGFPEDADGSRVSADFKDGMLQIHLRKSQKAKPKAIEIKVG